MTVDINYPEMCETDTEKACYLKGRMDSLTDHAERTAKFYTDKALIAKVIKGSRREQ